MRSIFAAVFPDRSSNVLEQVISGMSEQRATEHEKLELLLEASKLVLCAENHLDPARDQVALQNAVAHINEMVISIGVDYSDEEFYQAVREKYGAKGVRDAKKYVENMDEQPSELSHDEQLEFRRLMMELWMDSKEEAREKYTPKKYRKI